MSPASVTSLARYRIRRANHLAAAASPRGPEQTLDGSDRPVRPATNGSPVVVGPWPMLHPSGLKDPRTSDGRGGCRAADAAPVLLGGSRRSSSDLPEIVA